MGPTGNRLGLPGICTSIRTFMVNRGIISDEYTLQWDPGSESRGRQSRACSGFCTADNKSKQKVLFGTLPNGQVRPGSPPVTNCDEFPFASSMEGGDRFLGLNPATLTGVTRTCVAKYQNDLQGQCNCNSSYSHGCGFTKAHTNVIPTSFSDT